MRVVAVANKKKHGQLLESLGAGKFISLSQSKHQLISRDVIIDRQNLQAASDRIDQEVSGLIRFAFDTVGADTAAWCQGVLASRTATDYLQPSQPNTDSATGSTK
jgi:hypothetical protein